MELVSRLFRREVPITILPRMHLRLVIWLACWLNQARTGGIGVRFAYLILS
jgi:hypothetical protein